MANEAKRFHKKVAHMIADKTRESYGDVINCMRTKVSFAMLRSVLISVRGSRGKSGKVSETPLSYVSFNLIPEIQDYETIWTEERRNQIIYYLYFKYNIKKPKSRSPLWWKK